MPPDALLTVEGLRTHFFTDEGVVRAVDGVNLSLPAGRTVCVVGESGCGKSITARSILGLVDPPGRIVDGHIWWKEGTDLAALDSHGERMRQVRGGQIAMVFQEPMASLSPAYTIANQLTEAILAHRTMTRDEAWRRGVELLERVGIPRPVQTMNSFAFQLSGGMCQRVMIAMALSCEPSLLIADEPTTALDVTTQARIIDLLVDIQRDTGMSMMFITHDLGVVAEIADEVVVMYLGTVVEQGSVDDIFHDPKHPYTKALLASIPTMGMGARQPLNSIRGQVPHPLDRPAGCPFHPRCDDAVPGLCEVVEPPVVELDSTRRVRCVLHDPDVMAGHATPAVHQHRARELGEERR